MDKIQNKVNGKVKPSVNMAVLSHTIIISCITRCMKGCSKLCVILVLQRALFSTNYFLLWHESTLSYEDNLQNSLMEIVNVGLD